MNRFTHRPRKPYAGDSNHKQPTLLADLFGRIEGGYYSLPRTKRRIVSVVVIILGFLILLGLARLSQAVSTEVPLHEGTLTEGIVGYPRFINPVLATARPDRDLTALVYSGLLKPVTRPDGTTDYAGDLAESWKVSDNGLVYTVVIRPDARFHDGTPVQAEDIIFTVAATQKPIIRSPQRAAWDSIIVEKVDERTVRFVLPQPYTPFLENLTLGILPAHIWKDVDAEQFAFDPHNIRPVGSGPFRLARVKQNRSGAPVAYTLTAFDKYTLGKPYIDRLIMRFYTDQDDLVHAYNKGEIDAAGGISPDLVADLKDRGQVYTIPLLRTFAAFFNQNQQPIFADKTVRQALTVAVDQQDLIDQVLAGYATPLTGPLPTSASSTSSALNFKPGDVAAAITILNQNDWHKNKETGIMEKSLDGKTTPLAFTITTSDVPELIHVANFLAGTWQKLGADVTVDARPIGDLNQNVIRTRDFDVLVFGESIGHSQDLFAFWHSSQRNDPGLNIAGYTNHDVDDLLEDARSNTNQDDRATDITRALTNIIADKPAVFLYAPDFIYLVPDTLRGINVKSASIPAERFQNINQWYVATERIWNIFR